MRLVGGKTAKEISQELLEATADAMLANDLDAFLKHFRLPHTIETGDSKKTLHTREEFRVVFDSVVEDYKLRRIDKLVRICDVAEFLSDIQIQATHTSHLMSGNLRVVDPFPCYSILDFVDGRWQVTSSQYAVDKHTSVGRAIAAKAH